MSTYFSLNWFQICIVSVGLNVRVLCRTGTENVEALRGSNCFCGETRAEEMLGQWSFFITEQMVNKHVKLQRGGGQCASL